MNSTSKVTQAAASCRGKVGTVATELSAPFQRGVPAEQLLTPEASARHLLRVISGLTPADSGGCFAWDGNRIEA